MSWNAPNKTGYGRSKATKRTTRFWGWVLGGVLALGLGVVCLMLIEHPNGHIDPKEPIEEENVESKRMTIRAGVPAAAPSATTKKEYSEMDNSEKLQYWKNMYGDNPPENIKPII